MSSLLVESNAYYLVSSDLLGANFQLNDHGGDPGPDTPGTLIVSNNTGGSSENWQFFYQDHIFLIRNYDYKATYQLGITTDLPTTPALLPASGELTQQWNMTLWGDGTYKLTNMWLGDVQLLGTANKDVTNPLIVPVMTPAQNGSHWSLAINPSNATMNLPDSMLQPVSLQAAPSLTSTSPSVSTASSARSLSSSTSSASSSASSSATSTILANSQSTSSRSLSGGDIAGIVVAIVGVALIVSGLGVFARWRRRKKQRNTILTDQGTLVK